MLEYIEHLTHAGQRAGRASAQVTARDAAEAAAEAFAPYPVSGDATAAWAAQVQGADS